MEGRFGSLETLDGVSTVYPADQAATERVRNVVYQFLLDTSGFCILTHLQCFRQHAVDIRHDYGAERWIGIGLLRNIVAVTVYLEWEDEETIRIVSARKATCHESKEYHKRVAH